jgi:hypothetical protein
MLEYAMTSGCGDGAAVHAAACAMTGAGGRAQRTAARRADVLCKRASEGKAYFLDAFAALSFFGFFFSLFLGLLSPMASAPSELCGR